MAQVDMNVVHEFVSEIKQPQQERNSVYSAIVSNVDSQGVVWVNIAGSDKETPTALSSAEVKKGDTVSVEFRNNKWYIGGNFTNPSAGTQRVTAVENNAYRALNAANSAETSAASAQASAEAASVAAQDAQTTANAVHDIAVQAQTDATAASQAASAASTAASQAQTDATAAGTAASAAQSSANAAGIAASRAQAAADAAQGDIDDQQEYFWHDALGAHVLSDADTSNGRYRTDIKGAGFEINQVPASGSEITVASFGASGAQIGQSGAAHSVIDADGQRFYAADGTTQLANIGYGEGAAESGTAVAPYYTFGTRTGASRGNYSIAEGVNTTASALASHSEGRYTQATDNDSHAEGYSSKAKGAHSHAEGDAAIALGTASHAQNQYTIAAKRSQTAIGTFNEEDTSTSTTHPSGISSYGDYAFIIGNGTNSNARSNALTVDWNGNVEAAGDITVKGHSSPIGKVESAGWNVSSSSASGGTPLTGSITLTPGVWLIVVSLPSVSRTHQYYLSNISGPKHKYYSAVSMGTFSCIYQADSTITTAVMSGASASTSYTNTDRGHLEAVRIA